MDFDAQANQCAQGTTLRLTSIGALPAAVSLQYRRFQQGPFALKLPGLASAIPSSHERENCAKPELEYTHDWAFTPICMLARVPLPHATNAVGPSPVLFTTPTCAPAAPLPF